MTDPRSGGTVKERKLAVIRNACFRYERSDGGLVLAFDTYWEPAVAALQILSVEQAVELLGAYRATQVSDLNGKTCWVQHSHEGGSALGSSIYDGPAPLGVVR